MWPQLTELFFVTTAITFITTLVVMLVYTKLKLVEQPSQLPLTKKIHSRPVPRGGGAAIFAGLLLTSWWYLSWTPELKGILFGGLILTLVGILDDVYDISPYLRLVSGALVGVVVVLSGISIEFITNPLVSGEVIRFDTIVWPILWGSSYYHWPYLAHGLTILWVVWMMNMVNWSKGVDGQMPGFVTIAAIIIGILSLRFIADGNQLLVTQLAILTAGAFLGFLFWNAYPQKIMPGYGGGSLAGYLLAVLAITSGAKLATMILVLGIPTIDAIYTIIRRILAGRSPVWGDRGHLHHRLLDIGWTKKQIAYFYWGMSLILGSLSLTLNSTQKLFSVLSLALVLPGVIIWLKAVRAQIHEKSL